jgi:hypothetical protein
MKTRIPLSILLTTGLTFIPLTTALATTIAGINSGKIVIPGGTGLTGGITTGGVSGGVEGGVSGGVDGGITTGGVSGGVSGGVTGGITGGGTSGGESNGGTAGGESAGGTAGGTSTGGTTGSSTGGVTETPAQSNIRVRPLIFASLDIQEKIINLTKGEMKNATSPMVLDDYRNGFKVNKQIKFDVGMGAALINSATRSLPGFTGIVGLAISRDNDIEFELIANNKEELDNLKMPDLPFTTDLLDQYKVGESVAFESMGGLILNIAGGTYGVYAGSTKVAEGGFKTEIKKLAQNKVLVQTIAKKIHSESVFTGAAILKLEAKVSTLASNGVSFLFDLNNASSKVAYEALLAGDATVAQELAEQSALSGVVNTESVNLDEITHSRGGSIGIPLLFSHKWSNGKIYGESERIDNLDNTVTELNYGVYFKGKNGRFLKHHKNLIRTFYSGVAVNKAADGAVRSQDQRATYLWSFENDSARKVGFDKIVKTLQQDLGLRNSFNPITSNKEKLGYVKVEASLDIPHSYTKALMDSTDDRTFADIMSKRAVSLISKYFAQDDLDGLCGISREDYRADCKDYFVRSTLRSVKRMKKILSQMKNSSDNTEFTKLHAKLGKQLVKNQFVLGTAMALDENCQLSYNLKVEGERLSQIAKKVPANPACR